MKSLLDLDVTQCDNTCTTCQSIRLMMRLYMVVHILHVTWNFTAWNFWLLLYYGNIVWSYRINCGVSKILNQQQCILFFMFYTIFERQSIFTPNCNTVSLPFSQTDIYGLQEKSKFWKWETAIYVIAANLHHLI